MCSGEEESPRRRVTLNPPRRSGLGWPLCPHGHGDRRGRRAHPGQEVSARSPGPGSHVKVGERRGSKFSSGLTADPIPSTPPQPSWVTRGKGRRREGVFFRFREVGVLGDRSFLSATPKCLRPTLPVSAPGPWVPGVESLCPSRVGQPLKQDYHWSVQFHGGSV